MPVNDKMNGKDFSKLTPKEQNVVMALIRMGKFKTPKTPKRPTHMSSVKNRKKKIWSRSNPRHTMQSPRAGQAKKPAQSKKKPPQYQGDRFNTDSLFEYCSSIGTKGTKICKTYLGNTMKEIGKMSRKVSGM